MFEFAAPSPASAPFPGLPLAQALTLQTTANTGDTPLPADFEALLALQTAPAPAAIFAALPAAPIRQPGGKTLPDTALPVAANSNPAATPPGATDDSLTSSDMPPPISENLPIAYTFVLPDPALMSAIFAAPQRLAPQPEAVTPTETTPPVAAATTPASPPEDADIVPAIRNSAAARIILQHPAAAAIAVARTTIFELEPTPVPAPVSERPEGAVSPAPVTLAATAMIAQRTPRPATPAQATATIPEPSADQPVPLAMRETDPAQPLEAAPEPAAPIIQSHTSTAPQQDAAPAARAEPRAERIDFETLVEALSRAREEASPNTVRASINHAEFGRVSLRFENDDKGALQVAMNSADPGFARAVTASNEAASTQTQPDTQRGSHQQATAGNGGESARQQQGQPPGASARPQRADKLRGDDPQSSPDGIFA